MNTRLEAILQIQPLQIINISFIRSIFEFHLEKVPKINPIPMQNFFPVSFMFSSDVNFYIENNEQFMEVFTQVKAHEDDKLCSFQVDCMGKYSWNGDELTSELERNAFACAVTAQLSAMREHIARETASGPFKVPYYLPISLIGVTERNR
jgi:hypothetical protein